MIGNKYNKKQGQALLIAIMVFATVLTVTLSLSFKSTSETQIAKLEEESQKALAAAEAGLEKSIKQSTGGTFASLGLDLSGINLSESSVTFEDTQTNTFTSPYLQKDEQYTFYVANYHPETNSFDNSIQQDITICFPGGSPNPALEITLVKSSSIKRYVVDPESRIANAALPNSNSNCPSNLYPYSYLIGNTDIGNDSKLLIVRLLYNGGKIFFSRENSNFPLQGKTIISEAKTTAGVIKKVKLFQSYPQIPADFFVTSF